MRNETATTRTDRPWLSDRFPRKLCLLVALSATIAALASACAAILFVALRVISMIYGVRVGWSYYRDNLTLDRLYWPFVTFATLVATVVAFY